jgi:hypothetical protein
LSLGSGVSIVQASTGEDSTTAGARGQATGSDDSAAEGAAVSAEIRTAFWSLVILLNLSIGALAVGVMLVGFRGQWASGGALVLVGVAGVGAAYGRYRTVRHQLDSGDVIGDPDPGDGQ